MNYLNKYKILSDNQFGFRKNHSTQLALTLLYDKISSAIDNMITVGIFIDLSKAFDTVNHQILLDKLQYYGVRRVAHDSFSNYLQNRQQFVQYNGTNSSYHNIKCGVPQGSILGPLLFLIYVNDLRNVSKALDFILFADDTNIFFLHKNLNILEKTLNEELPKLTDWCLANTSKLSINYKKSNFMIFKSKQKRQTFDISCGYTTPRLGVFPRLMISAWCRLGVPRVSDYPKRRGYTPNKLPKANKLKHFHLAGNG